MGIQFWLKRFAQAFIIMFIVDGVVQWFKSHSWEYALTQALIWGVITAFIYVAFLYRKLKQNPSCALREAEKLSSVKENDKGID